MLSIANAWSPSSWKSLPIKQSPDWPVNQLNDVVNTLKSFPPLVPIHEIDNLKNQFKSVANNESFILIAGDCAETFSDFNQSLIEKKITNNFSNVINSRIQLRKAYN